MRVAVIGGGAAGFFAALQAKQSHPKVNVTIFERTAKLLSKVRISGGGRCNVTHACFDPRELVKNYPRGSRELLGPFHTFGPTDTIQWFKERGVELKAEADGRMFPTTDSSDTIIQCFLEEASRLGVKICLQTKLESIQKTTSGFELNMREKITVDRVILACGSSRLGHDLAMSLGHTVQTPVPSLFTFNIPSFSLKDLSGVATRAKLKIGKLEQTGPLLITHFGFSGPAALKLSAFGARFLAEKEYHAKLQVDWIPEQLESDLQSEIDFQKKSHPKKRLVNTKLTELPKSLWRALLHRSGFSDVLLGELSKSKIFKLLDLLKRDPYQVHGKTTNKEEFVTCGGITLKEVNFKTMESKCTEGLYFCGEILDIDGITGGFNFQNAWTTGYLAGSKLF